MIQPTSILKTVLATSAALALASACGVVKVNGKPLGGGSSGGGMTAAQPGNAPAAGTPTGAAPAGATSASGGAAAAAPAAGTRPAWCDEYGYPSSSSYKPDWFAGKSAQDILANSSNGGVFGEVVCATTWDEPGDRAKMMAARAAWMAAAGYDERDAVVVAGEAKGYSDDSQEFAAMGGAVAQLADQGTVADLALQLDQLGPNASALAGFRMVDRCFEAGLGVVRHTDLPLLQVVRCTRETLDATRALAEIDATPQLNASSRKNLRRMVKRAGDAAAAARVWLDGKTKEDPGIAKVVAIADAQFQAWTPASPARAALAADLARLEAATKANKRSGFAGCEAPARAAWEGILKRVALPKVPSDHVLSTFIEATLSTPEGYLAYQALRLCSASMEDNFYQGGDIIGSDVLQRGPRTGTVAAWLAAAGEVRFDDRDLKLERMLKAGSYNDSLDLIEGIRYQRVTKGVIDRIDERDGYVEISFTRVTAMIEDCLNWQQTNRIESISDSGQVQYRSVCKTWGKRKADLTAPPVKVGKVMAAGLRPGMYLLALEDGMPIVATASAGSSTPVWVMGGTVR
ncbi:MAG: hypothetical protein R3B06_15400 [Kofleriaceae bacterium]